MAMIKAIQTEYNGIKFRSRLEARWAVFFDTAKIRYEYEPEGYETEDGGKYLPDFYLPDFDLYVEVKRDTEEGIKEIIEKCEPAIQWGGAIKQILILSDVPQGKSIDGGLWHFPCIYWSENSTCWGWWFFFDCTDDNDEDCVVGHVSGGGYIYAKRFIEKEKSISAVSDYELRNNTFGYCQTKKLRELLKHCELNDEDSELKYEFEQQKNWHNLTLEQDISMQMSCNKLVFNALAKARKARFEFGETPTKEE